MNTVIAVPEKTKESDDRKWEPYRIMNANAPLSSCPGLDLQVYRPGSFYSLQEMGQVLGNDHIVMACVLGANSSEGKRVLLLCLMAAENDRLPSHYNSYPIAGISVSQSPYEEDTSFVKHPVLLDLAIQTACQLTAAGYEISIAQYNRQYCDLKLSRALKNAIDEENRKAKGYSVVRPSPFSKIDCIKYDKFDQMKYLNIIDPPLGLRDPVLLNMASHNMISYTLNRVTAQKRKIERLTVACRECFIGTITPLELYRYFEQRRFIDVDISEFIQKER